MRRTAVLIALSCSSLACTGSSEPAKPSEAKPAVAEAKIAEAAKPPPAPEAKAPEPAKAPEAAAPETKTEPPIEALPAPPAEAPVPAPAESTGEAPAETPPVEAAPATPVPEIAIRPWAIAPRTSPWTLVAEPAAPLVLTDLTAGVLGRAGDQWWQLGDDGVLATVAMNPEPELPVLGVWPGDAWFVNHRFRKYDHGDDAQEYLELRLMKLRGTNRWVPQVYSGNGEQWFHPGTDDEVEPHISAVSGMLVYPRSLTDITRVAGRIPDPMIGPHRGDAIDFLEAASGKVYVLSRDADGTYAQIQCEDDACVAASTNKLPLSQWSFGRRLARGKHSVTVLASSESREFMLHHKGKADGWSLDELPAGEKPGGMWASAEGGLWTLTGAHLRWRDIDGGWFEVALPDGLTSPSVAVTVDRTRVLVSGVVGGAAKLFSTHANAKP